MAELITREIPSRKRQRVTAIPWAQAEVKTAQGYPAWFIVPSFHNDGLQRTLQDVRLDQYPPSPFFLSGDYPATQTIAANKSSFARTNQTPLELNEYISEDPAAASGFFPGSKLAQSNVISFKRKLQSLPELDRFFNPAFDAGFYPGSGLISANNSSFDIARQDLPELNRYKETPPGFLDGFFPGSKLAESNVIQFKVKHQTPEKLDRFKPTESAAPLTAFLEPVSHKTKFKRKLNIELMPGEFTRLLVDLPSFELPPLFKVDRKTRHLVPLEVDTYPLTIPLLFITAFTLERSLFKKGSHYRRLTVGDALTIKTLGLPHSFGVISLIDDSGQGLTSAIDATGQGVSSSITASLGVLSLIDSSGVGVTSLVDTTGKGAESDI